jgi:uncharacterized protein YjdB
MKRFYPLFAFAAIIFAGCDLEPTSSTVAVKSVSVAPTELVLEIGDTETLVATVLPENADNKAVTWSSSAPAIVTVNASTGEILALTHGLAVITATTDSGFKTATCTVTVNKPIIPTIPVERVTVTPTTLTLDVGNTATLTATVLPANADNKTVSWSTNAPAIATVDTATGKVTAVAAGQATITVTTQDGGKTATCAVTVNTSTGPVPVEGVTISPASLSFEIGASRTLTATVLPDNASNKTVTWSSSAPSIARIDANTGVVTGVAQGQAIITVTTQDGGKTATCPVTITRYYTSTDFSRDREVITLQAASVGNGINIVLMGDGFSDRMIENGTYENVMRTMLNIAFLEEPFTSFRDMFDVYAVIAVSPNETFGPGADTAFDCTFGSGGSTGVDGNKGLIMQYALGAVGANEMDETMILVVTNTRTWHGTSHYTNPPEGDHAPGLTVTFFTRGANDNQMRELQTHETGHGFSKLGDEYFYSGTIPAYEVNYHNRVYTTSGWERNVDVISDPAQVHWAKYLTDPRYDDQGLGVFEGALTYRYGAWRPTNYSIMRENFGGYNAPSRESIYYRIHKLAYGLSWQYDHETFVAWDLAQPRTVTPFDIKPMYVPLAPPVHTGKTWQEIMNE